MTLLPPLERQFLGSWVVYIVADSDRKPPHASSFSSASAAAANRQSCITATYYTGVKVKGNYFPMLLLFKHLFGILFEPPPQMSLLIS